MTRVKRHIDANVVDEARRRIHHIYDLVDNVVVAFSGGKDSLALLHLTWEVAQERGLTAVNVAFRDEEVIPDTVLSFVDTYRQLPWVNMTWYAVPLISSKYVLGKTSRYIQWDPNREHVRPKPAWATTLDDLGYPPDTVFSQLTMDSVLAAPYKGKVAIMTGVRASESLMRWQSSVVKLNENYICASSTPKASLCKPLFDWQENDVLRFFYDNEIRYCPIYDAQAWAGNALRVATPLIPESAKALHYLRATEPVFYDQVMEIFPEMALQERYHAEIDRAGILARYAESWDGIEQWITDHFDEAAELANAMKALARVKVAARRAPDSFPLPYVLKQFTSGAYKRRILPQAFADQTKSDQAQRGTRG
ncbi:peptidase S14 [Amycolatopsis sp. WAC 04197]|uniref:phosphoadenosine phosphosulfate reductase domain-containing protein n=1 Tax=Amycolatopsis sp. WAC 04197 TaxID=2203199 RepID=UPI000F77F181|nr:phosphoadenosine phosphosulfate reductase family protein [Amycolatopsis sp. WAC 04197]RSN38583.1 peptidase S14 [Amycolatopsis sp. WAC 04197]